LLEFSNDYWEHRSEPNEQLASRGVPNAQPNDGRPGTTTAHPLSEVFVFGYDCGRVFLGVTPEFYVFSCCEADVEYVFGLMSTLTQPRGERGRELSVN